LLAWLTPFSVVQAAGVALIVNLMGFFGAMVLAAIKRDRGVKDWGTSVAGYGGMLDRLDSVIFAAPIYFQILRYGWEP
jgi:phosphatidate cytidylyltransferase